MKEGKLAEIAWKKKGKGKGKGSRSGEGSKDGEVGGEPHGAVREEKKAGEGKGDGDGWSDWIWDDQNLFYYRARKHKETWQYEYADITAPSSETSKYVTERKIEFVNVKEEVVFVEVESSFEVHGEGKLGLLGVIRAEGGEHGGSGEEEGVLGSVGRKEDETAAGAAVQEGKDEAESGSASGKSRSSHGKARRGEEMKVKFEEDPPGQSVRVERVVEWRARVNSALQGGEKVEDGDGDGDGEGREGVKEPQKEKLMKLERVKRMPRKDNHSYVPLERKRYHKGKQK